jgi:hypothetical protein
MHRVLDTALSFILFAISVALATGQSQQNDKLIGRWRSTEVSPSGVSAVFEFHGDSQLDSYSAAISEEKYQMIGTDTILLLSKEWAGRSRKSSGTARIGRESRMKRPASPSN